MIPKPAFLVGPRLLLRDFVLEDWPAVHSYTADREVLRFLEWNPDTIVRSRGFVEKAITEAAASPRVQFKLAMVLQVNGELIGDCGLKIVEPKRRHARLGYIVNRSYWGHGYATEAARLLLQFGFRELGLYKISAGCDLRNAASIRVLEKIGMTREALFPSTAVYSILEKDFLVTA